MLCRTRLMPVRYLMESRITKRNFLIADGVSLANAKAQNPIQVQRNIPVRPKKARLVLKKVPVLRNRLRPKKARLVNMSCVNRFRLPIDRMCLKVPVSKTMAGAIDAMPAALPVNALPRGRGFLLRMLIHTFSRKLIVKAENARTIIE